VALKQRDYMTARSQLQAVLSGRWDLGEKQGSAEALAGLAAVARAQGQLRRAAALGGAAEALFESIGSRIRSLARANFSHVVADLSKAMGEHQFATIWAEGRAMTLEQAIEYALEPPREQAAQPQTPRQAAKQEFGGLTAREREVAACIAQGKSNREIAEELVIGERTVESHVANILNKLGFTSRAQIRKWAIEKGLVKRVE